MTIQPVHNNTHPVISLPGMTAPPSVPGVTDLAEQALALVARVELQVIRDTVELADRPGRDPETRRQIEAQAVAKQDARKAQREAAAARKALRERLRTLAAQDREHRNPGRAYTASELSAMATAVRRLNIRG